MKEIFSSVFSDFCTDFLDNERAEATSLLKDYLKHNFNLEEHTSDAFISTIFGIAEAIEWRKKEFNK